MPRDIESRLLPLWTLEGSIATTADPALLEQDDQLRRISYDQGLISPKCVHQGKSLYQYVHPNSMLARRTEDRAISYSSLADCSSVKGLLAPGTQLR